MAMIASAMVWTMTGAKPSEGSSSRIASGLPMSVRAMASICCSPPDICPPRRPRISARLGKRSNSRSRVQERMAAVACLAADFQVLVNRQVGENTAVLRHVAEPEPGDAVSGPARDGLALEGEGFGPRRDQPHDGFEGRGLAGAVAADQRHHLAGFHLKRKSEQDLRAAIARRQVGECREATVIGRGPPRARRPDRPAAPSGRRGSRPGFPPR